MLTINSDCFPALVILLFPSARKSKILLLICVTRPRVFQFRVLVYNLSFRSPFGWSQTFTRMRKTMLWLVELRRAKLVSANRKAARLNTQDNTGASLLKTPLIVFVYFVSAICPLKITCKQTHATLKVILFLFCNIGQSKPFKYNEISQEFNLSILGICLCRAAAFLQLKKAIELKSSHQKWHT